MDNYKKPSGNRRGKQTPDFRKKDSNEERPSRSSSPRPRTSSPRKREEGEEPREKKPYLTSRPVSSHKRDEDEKPREKRPFSTTRPSYSRRRDEDEKPKEKRPFSGSRSSFPKRRDEDDKPREYSKRRDDSERPRVKREYKPFAKRKPPSGEVREENELIRLNRYIANAGICSRREADKLIEAGAVQVNGKVVTELGTKVSRTDKVSYGDQALNREKLRYVLLNKPKGFITTTDDPENRKTVMTLIARACKERIYPVGRLDRNTTGLLLFTNDGEIAKRLSHPRYGIKKIYHVGLDKNVTGADMKAILAGVELEDGLVKADAIEFVGDSKDKSEIGLELHTGQNRVVRRIFEKLGYKVVKLDRVYYAGLTKKNLPRGEWRFLEEKELNMLKMIGV
jgi:23S rRNA pseudouridine2605 synthase